MGKIVITGNRGRMETALLEEARRKGLDILSEKRADTFSKLSEDDVIIDFSSPEKCLAMARGAAGGMAKMVVGTTGFTPTEFSELKETLRETPCVYSPNFSVAMTTMTLIAQVAGYHLHGGYKAEIWEKHHINKADSPSGSAFALEKSARAGMRGGQIPICSTRQGSEIGEHSIKFFSDTEVLEIRHKALDRKAFAQGALMAAEWVLDCGAGWFSMQDVLELRN